MKKAIIFALSLLATTACKQENYATYGGTAQGTYYSVIVNCADQNLGESIEAVFTEMDLTFSMFNPQSLVSRLNRNETVDTTPLFVECFSIARRTWEQTAGYYDPTVKPLVDAWGFGPEEQQEIPCVECLMEYVGMDKIRVVDGRLFKDDPRVQLDFSSVAKGFTVDRLAGMLDRKGAEDYMIYIGGEVRTKGVNAAGNRWRVGIEEPVGGFSGNYEAVVVFDDVLSSIATSGNYRNRFVDDHGRTRVHTIDPRTGLPAIGNILSVSIVSERCGDADAMATGLMAAADLDEARNILPPSGFEYCILYTDEHGETGSLSSAAFPFAEQ